ncbi:hypothetical protein B5M43_007900 [Microbacterium sp. MEC084]|uniref:hypothetical protein n=1 Tax=unclassified Microbacterium TaxID=2609290 RepID=UPI0006F8DA3C|nr:MULTISPECIES: hypothetical protein [unclassified Microbacterium]KQY99315.1 hypothetical protein ASD19_05435 [Microbacterium sp. Root53]MCD1268765.1 hypothetical protein [Microbacterium sp. MEC084]
MTAVSFPKPTAAMPSLRITTAERLALRAADALAAHIHRQAMRRGARLMADLERERLLGEARMAAAHASARTLPRL